MINSLMFTNYLDESLTVTLKEAEPSHGLLVKSVKGLGAVKAQINDIDLVNTDGSLFNSSRRLKRNIVAEFLFTGADIESVRHLTYKYFPEKKFITVRVNADHRRAEAYGYIEHNEDNIFSKEEGCQISIICDDPNFYSVEGTGYQDTKLYGAEPLFEFPFENDSLSERLIEFGSVDTHGERIILYDGEIETGLLITLHFKKPISSVMKLHNLTNGETLIINLFTIPNIIGREIRSGDRLIISTVRDNLYLSYLSNGVYTNALNAIDRHSDWLSLVHGENRIYYDVQGQEDGVDIDIRNRIIFRGI